MTIYMTCLYFHSKEYSIIGQQITLNIDINPGYLLFLGKYISFSVLRTSELSRVHSMSENADVFNSQDEIYLVVIYCLGDLR